MDKRGLTRKMAKDAGITAYQAEKAFQSLMKGIKGALKKSERVTISGFGSFEIKKRRARTGRNPRTGESIRIPAKRRVKFNPSNIFKKEL